MDKLELTTGRLAWDVKEGGETLLQVSLQHPLISVEGHPLHSALNRCFSRTAENIGAALSQDMLGEARAAAELLPEALPYQISGSFTPTYNAPGVLSFFTDVFLYAGGLRGITHRYVSSFLTADGGTPLFLTALFPAGADIRRSVTDFVIEAYGRRQGLDALPESTMAAVRDFYTPENVYLTENGLMVFYQPQTIGPVAAGVLTFLMPYGEEGPFPPRTLLSK